MMTSVARTKTGWQGNTRMDLDDGKVLCIMTAKASDGSLVTTASVRHVMRGPHGVTETSSRHDYSKHWMRWNVRATEKQVRLQHSKAMEMIDDMRRRIDLHYSVDRA